MADSLVPKMLPLAASKHLKAQKREALDTPAVEEWVWPLWPLSQRSRDRRSGATLEWCLMDYRGPPARHHGARSTDTLAERTHSPLDSEICMISPQEQHDH